MRSFFAACLSAFAVACGGCNSDAKPHSSTSASASATASDAQVPAESDTAVIFHGSDGDLTVHVEIADDDRKRAYGLMNREHMDDDRGMIFIFPRERVQTFWMKNTLIPLDMVFVDHERKIVGIVENAEPQSLVERTVRVPSMYVIEVNGGYTRAHGITPGSPVRFNHIL